MEKTEEYDVRSGKLEDPNANLSANIKTNISRNL